MKKLFTRIYAYLLGLFADTLEGLVEEAEEVTLRIEEFAEKKEAEADALLRSINDLAAARTTTILKGEEAKAHAARLRGEA